jgi:hypothetical protein
MNKYQLYTLGGTLLAATSLSGVASAGTVGNFTNAGNVFSTTAIKIANTVTSPTATTANSSTIGSAANLGFRFTNTYSNTFNLYLTAPVTGGTFVGTPTARYLIGDSTGTIVTTASASDLNVGVAPTVSALANQLFISNVAISFSSSIAGLSTASATLVGVVLEGVQFSNVAGLATAGGSISLGLTVASQANQSQIFETIAATPVVTAAAPFTTTVSAGTATSVAVGTAPTQFTQLTGSSLTLTLASIAVTGTGTVGTDLATAVTADGIGGTQAAASLMQVSVSSAALSDPAAVSVQAFTNAFSTVIGTLANFSGGTATFTLAPATVTFSTSTSVSVQYSGTTAISAAAAGSVSVTFSGSAFSLVAPSSASGATAVVSRGGLNSEINFANNGASPFQSYIRIHNTGNIAATATVLLKNDATGTQLGSTTYTTASVPAGGTIQVPISTVETALGVTPSGSYTAVVSGSFPGYIQHISFNPTTGAFADLSGYRSGGAVTP